VYLVKTNEELAKHLLTVVKAHRTAAISQFIPAKAEIRLIMLDNSLLLAYKKTAAAGEWRFNLSKGAVAELLEHSNVDETLVNSAQKALKALGLRVAAVDFLMSSDGPRLLEVNAGIMLNNLAQQGSAQKDIAIQSYRTILQKMFI
jgi:ribosomal protein S6--L-glutamate ligase